MIQRILIAILIVCVGLNLTACYNKKTRRAEQQPAASKVKKRYPYQHFRRGQIRHLKNAEYATLPHHLDQDETDVLTRVHHLGVRVVHEDVRLRLLMPPQCGFSRKSSTVNPRLMEVLDRVVAVLKHNNKTMAVVHGYSDGKGNAKANQALSERRAHAAIAYMESQGIPSNRLVTEGYGSQYPIASNDTEIGRELNRRVEITLLEGPIYHDNYSPTG